MKKGILPCLISGIIGGGITYAGCQFIRPKQGNDSGKVYKFKSYYNMLNQWLEAKNNGKKLETFFIENHYQKIAIYGMGEMGARLLEELNGSAVKVVYGIDKDGGSPFDEIPTFSMDDELDMEIDAVVVTAVFAFDSIETELKDTFQCPIISLEDVVLGVD